MLIKKIKARQITSESNEFIAFDIYIIKGFTENISIVIIRRSKKSF